MPHPDKIKKLQSILRKLKNQLAKSGAISLSRTLRSHKLPADYGMILLAMGVLIKMDSGKRGPSSYSWNPKFSPDYDTSEIVISKYNQRRASEKNKRNEGQSFTTNRDLLTDLRQTLINISVRMNRIEKALGVEIEL